MVYSPVDELNTLHTAVLANLSNVPLVAGVPKSIFNSAGAAGTVADVNVSFATPGAAGTLTVDVLGVRLFLWFLFDFFFLWVFCESKCKCRVGYLGV